MSGHMDWLGWRAARVGELSAPESWLSVIGLVPLAEGGNTVGSGADCSVRLPSGPAQAGTLTVHGIDIEWQACCQTPVRLDVDLDGIPSTPSTVAIDQYRLFAVERNGALSMRIKDTAWADTRPFAGLACFEFDPDWVIDARWQELPSPMTLEVPSVVGDLKKKTITHRAIWTLADGTTQSLLPVYADAHAILFVFRDRTSGPLTYGGGRFLRVPIPEGARIKLDFNRAFNPPCAFTAFATCPLPPPENWLPFAVEAGELKYGKA